MLARAFDKFAAESFLRDVARVNRCLPASLFDQRNDFLRVCLFAFKVIQSDVGAFARKGYGSRPADPRIRACDQSFATCQPPKSFIALLAMVGLGIHLFRQAWRRLHLLLEFRSRILLRRILHGELVLHNVVSHGSTTVDGRPG